MAAEEDSVNVTDISTSGATIGTQQLAGVPNVEDKSESSMQEAGDSTAFTSTIEGKGQEGAASHELIEPTLDPSVEVEEEYIQDASDVHAKTTMFIPAEVAAEGNDLTDPGEVSEVNKSQTSLATPSEFAETTTLIMPSQMQLVASGVEDYAPTVANESINAPGLVDAFSGQPNGVTKTSISPMDQATMATIVEAKHVEEVTLAEEDLKDEAGQVVTAAEEVSTEKAAHVVVSIEMVEHQQVTMEEEAAQEIPPLEAPKEEGWPKKEAAQEEAARDVIVPKVIKQEVVAHAAHGVKPKEQVELMTIRSEKEIDSNVVDATPINSSMMSGRAGESQGSAPTTNTAEAEDQTKAQAEAKQKGKAKVVSDNASKEELPSIKGAGSNVESDESYWDEEFQGESQFSHVAEPSVTWNISATTIDLNWGHNNYTFPPRTIFQIDTKLGTSKAWTTVYYGSAYSYQLAALPPASKVGVRIRTLTIEGWTFETSFITKSGPPSEPSKPVVLKHGTDSIELAWRSPVHDGGRFTEFYCVEMYVKTQFETFKSHTVSTTHDNKFVATELEPGTNYVVCVYAHNELGDSPHSVSVVMTNPVPPTVPKAPLIENSTSKAITLRWLSPRCNGEPVRTFVLEMLDLGYGEKSLLQETVASPAMVSEVYRGQENEFVVKKLHPLTTYAFRVQAINAIGSSGFSEFSVCKTSVAAPSPPEEPRVIETKSTAAKLIWMAPERDNGAPVFKYTLEMQEVEVPTPSEPKKLQGKNKVTKKQAVVAPSSPTRAWIVVYDGQELRFEITGLSPGRQYRFRVKAQNAYGSSSPSSVSVANLLATAPGAPPPPSFDKVSPTTMQVKWTAPESDNGMRVSRYALYLDDGRGGPLRKIYEGEARLHNLSNLIRASNYRAAVQAINACGASELSEVAVIKLPVFEAPSTQPPATIDVKELPHKSKAPEKVVVRSARPKLTALEVQEWEKPAPQSPPKRTHLPLVVDVPKTLKKVHVKVESPKAPTHPGNIKLESPLGKLVEASPPTEEKPKPTKLKAKGEIPAPKKLAAAPPEQEKSRPAKLPIVASKPKIVGVQKKDKVAASKSSGSLTKGRKPAAHATTVVALAAPKATSLTQAPPKTVLVAPTSTSSSVESIKSKREMKLLVKKAHKSWLERGVDFVMQFKQFWLVWIVLISVVSFFSFKFFENYFHSPQ